MRFPTFSGQVSVLMSSLKYRKATLKRSKIMYSDRNLHLQINLKLCCILTFLNFVFHHRRYQQKALFAGIFPQKAEI